MFQTLESIIFSELSPFFSALILGILINFSPCLFCTNLTAFGFVSKDLDNKKRLQNSVLFYVLGKFLTYTFLGSALFFVANLLPIRTFFESFGELFFGVILIISGILILIFFNKNSHSCDTKKQNYLTNRLSAFSFGAVSALAFCPYSGVIFFGLLIPLSLVSKGGILLFPIFAFASILPFLLISFTILYKVQKSEKMQIFFANSKNILVKILTILFILIGIFICYEHFFIH